MFQSVVHQSDIMPRCLASCGRIACAVLPSATGSASSIMCCPVVTAYLDRAFPPAGAVARHPDRPHTLCAQWQPWHIWHCNKRLFSIPKQNEDVGLCCLRAHPWLAWRWCSLCRRLAGMRSISFLFCRVHLLASWQVRCTLFTQGAAASHRVHVLCAVATGSCC
jgi:hypothetical protein